MMQIYAIVKLNLALQVVRFGDEDSWRTAIATLKRDGIPFQAMKWHHGADQWQTVEVA